MAPEVMRGEKSTIKVDMWALGIILFQLITKKHPFDRDGNPHKMIEAVRDPNQRPNDLP